MTPQAMVGIAGRLAIVLLGAALATCAALNTNGGTGIDGAERGTLGPSPTPGSRLAETEAHRAEPGWLADNAGQVASRAHDVLRHEPLDAVALRQLAELSPNSPDTMRDLLRLSERVTRRDTTGQILLINLAAGANDFGEAVAHYDRAISVLPRLGPTLIPYLANGLTDPQVVKVLPRFATRPWFRALLAEGIEQGAPISVVAELALSARARLPAEKRAAFSAELIDRLLVLKRHADVRALVVRLGGTQRSILDDLAISAATTDSGNPALSWRLTDDGTTRAEFLPPSGLAITVAPAGSGIAAMRRTLLQPGSYRLQMRVTYDPASPRATVSWVLECPDGQTIWKAEIANDRESVSTDASFDIPQRCTLQTWRLDVDADDSQFASTARITRLSLHPL